MTITFIIIFLESLSKKFVEHFRNDTGIPTSKAADTTRILRKLLDDYDKRLRPNFGGKVVFNHNNVQV